MNNIYMDTSDSSDNPIDLSRRCDSVETRKTPSPYNSSSFPGTSPSLENDSPNSSIGKKSVRSDTPPNRYQPAEYVQSNFKKSVQESSRYAFTSTQREQPAKPVPHHHYVREQPIIVNNEINPYVRMQAVRLQQKLQSIPATVSPSSSESSYPMMLGRDGKLSRPFKIYPRDPLTNPFASIPSDSLEDRMSAERFTSFRRQALEKIRAENGGRQTITNPRMRRTSTKSYTESEQNQSDMDFQPQTQISCQSDSSEASGVNSGKKPIKDAAYYERRRKNNAAAKKSRDRRRIKEDEIAIRNAFLERENLQLKYELESVRQQLARYVAS